MLEALPLKEYQTHVLDALDMFLGHLHSRYARAEKMHALDMEDNPKEAVAPDFSHYCRDAWELTGKHIALPRFRDKKGNHLPNEWKDRQDGLGRKIPNLCFKVPTGGGKTLLASCALQRINQDYFKSNAGLVLWIVPSDTIYTQTLGALKNKEHPYRKQLDFASGGNTKVLVRNDPLNKQDVENNLCVMVLMLQSFNVSQRSKDARKLYSDNGAYTSFFPLEDDYNANNALLNAVPNLVEEDMLGRGVIDGITVKQSLGNVFRLCRPIVIVDEEHKAKTAKAIDNINQFNPKFILELSATPREGSNKLVDVGGQDLKSEQMIKLPINVSASATKDWRNTLEMAHDKLLELSKDAVQQEKADGSYIRPIMVIIAEPKKAKEEYDQVEDIRKYLIDKCQVNPQAIRVKLSGKDELKDTDLLDRVCGVKYIITKDALREGWDCSFAYVLTILTKKDSANALTQYTGRVLRQPYARLASVQSLNESYVYCSQDSVSEAVSKIKEGLEKEGMGDVSNDIHSSEGIANERQRITIKRKDSLKDRIFLPKLNSVLADGTLAAFDYYRDILGDIKWDAYTCTQNIIIADKTALDTSEAKVDYVSDLHGQAEFSDWYGNKTTHLVDEEINYSLLTSQLTDKIANPFAARRILNEVIENLSQTYEHAAIASAGHDIVRQIKADAHEWLLKQSEKAFVEKLKAGRIILKLIASPYHPQFNWPLGENRDVFKNAHETEATDWDKNAFQPQYKSNYNGLEKDVAAYINGSEAVKWWHRLGVKGTEYAVYGWKKDRIYPDFLILKNDEKYVFVETKGNHLKNPDSEYKAKVFDYLTRHTKDYNGEFKLIDGQKELSFNLVYEDGWQEDLLKLAI